MDEAIKKAQADFIAAAQRAFVSGIQTGNGGNISIRISSQNWMAVKASGFSLGECKPDNIVVTDFNGKIIQGNFKPTREVVLHGFLYQKFPEIGAVVHTHSPYSIGWSLSGNSIPLITKHAQMKLGFPIPVLPIKTPEVRIEDLPLIEALLKNQPGLPGFILQGHGIVSLAQNVIAAEFNAELIEETAQISWLVAIGKNIGLITQ